MLLILLAIAGAGLVGVLATALIAAGLSAVLAGIAVAKDAPERTR